MKKMIRTASDEDAATIRKRARSLMIEQTRQTTNY